MKCSFSSSRNSKIVKHFFFYVESVTKTHPKFAIKLSKLKVITQQPKKRKIYTESKANHFMIQLAVIKRHFS